jgi:CheY-like chemotaxis protein
LDDIPENTFVLKEIFARYEANVVTCNEGHEALSIIKGENKFDAIITDLRMPGMSGQTFIIEVRNYEKENNMLQVPIIILTAENDNTEKMNCLVKYGANEYLLKPIKLNLLMATVSRVLNKENTKSFKNIIVVEDEELSAQILDRILKSQGHKVTICGSISEVKHVFKL